MRRQWRISARAEAPCWSGTISLSSGTAGRDARWPSGPSNMWRYAPVLPAAEASIVTLGEGWTPLVRTRRLGARIGAEQLWVKDEGLNPTASFKARGLSCAVSMCVELGIKKVAIPSAGNAASAMAAYAAAAGIEAHIFMPRDVPQANYLECKAYGAHVTLVDGLISDCGRMVAEQAPKEGWFDVSTLKEPYRIEGKKTMGYEVAEQMDWELPDAIFYPTGGGVGMIGMWKAFDEMEKLGWIGSRRPKMIAVQADGCQPVVRAYLENEPRSRFYDGAHTVASGLRVPKPLGDFLVLQRSARERRHGDCGERRGHAGGRRADGQRRRHLRGARGRGLCGRGSTPAAVALPEEHGPHRDLQHRVGPEVSGGLLDALSRGNRRRAGQARRADHAAMKDLALRALDAVARRGVTYADVRAVDSREREISTKNGKAGHVSSAESQGIGIRVLAHGCWGFAATDDLTADGHREARQRSRSRSRARVRRREPTKWRWRRKNSTRPCGSRRCGSTRSPCRWIAIWRCCWRWTRNCGTTPV